VLSCPDSASPSSPTGAFHRLERFLRDRREDPNPVEDFESFEFELRSMLMEVENEIAGAELEKFDVDVPVVLIDGVAHRRALRDSSTYQTSAGKVSVQRTLYRRSGSELTVVPLDLRAGVVQGVWTPRAAKQAVFAVAHMPIAAVEQMFVQIGCMTPPGSSLDRLNVVVGDTWEKHRVEFEGQLREKLVVPAQAATVAVSLDGVMVPMRDGDRAGKRARAAEEGKQASGPAGFREAGCATLSFYDADGNRLETIRQGRMPRSGKPELKGWLVGELHAALARKPGLQVVKVADGALDNWEFLEGEKLPAGISVVDFFHAIEHLAVALTSAYGEGSDQFKERFRVLRRCLRDDSRGVGKVIRALRHLREEHPRSKIIARELAYFRSRRERMRYAALRARGLPIGSGVVEAACKSLATDRMKRSGMRWTQRGGQAVLTFRALIQSDRFEAGWVRVISAYKAHVSLPDNVIRFPGRTA
jgi:hypothetical protein